MCKQMIRAVNGHYADWAVASEYSPEVVWSRIGQRCRYLLTRIYLQLNSLTPKETRDFFEHCIVVVSTG